MLKGGAAADTLDGGAGDDTLVGGAGADSLVGGAGIDVADYSASATGVTVDLSLATAQSGGDAAGDILAGIENLKGAAAAASRLTGDAGANLLAGGAAADTLDGGAGNDTLVGGAGADSLLGGAGVDTADYSTSAGGVTVDLTLSTAQSGGDAAGDILSGVENVTGAAAAANRLTGDANGNLLTGGAAADTLDGGAGDDTLTGGAGADSLIGGAGGGPAHGRGCASAREGAGVRGVAAIDVGGTRIKAAMVYPDGSHAHARTVPTPRDLEQRLGEVAADIVGQLADAAGEAPLALGLAAPGLVDEHKAIGVFSANLGWRAFDLRGPVEEATGIPVAIGHDVRAGLLAESWIGAAAGCDDVLFVAIGTGVSAAVRVGGRELVAGGYAGEIGHLVVDPAGPECGCGSRGCLEAVASATAIARRYAAIARPGDAVDARVVAQRVSLGEPRAIAVWSEAIDHLARVLATAAITCGSRLIVVGGGLANAGETLTLPLGRAVSTYGGSLRPLQVAPAALGEMAGCLGAGLLALRLVELA